jgi:uncharacterized repeat protein (TIGR01451 family)
VAAAAVVFVAILALGSASALAAGSGYYVTFVARSCPEYTDIFANKARNDIQESLHDLGPDSPYNTIASLVDPAIESGPPQDACSPLPGWVFTLGKGYQSRAVEGPWGSLSKVTSPFPRAPIVTEASTPLYDEHHIQIDDQRIAGATTIELTDAERQQASTSSQLWVQGGTPADPVLADPYPGPMYGFGALRCATDDVNGDNVEYIYFPAGVTHVFCYAFYVLPPPTAGTITITKRVLDAPVGEHPSFAFNGSISFDPAGFTLADGQSMDFYRAGGASWDLTETTVPNYRLTSVDCTATGANGGPGSSTTTVTGATTTIDLVAEEHVTCVYTNQYHVPAGGLVIDKVTGGGTGSFQYTVTPDDGGASHHSTATTLQPGVPAEALPALGSLPPGGYTIAERAPSTDTGQWRTVRVVCDGVRESLRHPVGVTIRDGATTTCVFVNAFTPAGAISLAKVSTGKTGTVTFLVGARTGPATQYVQHATTTVEGVAADAVPDSPGDATDHLRLGRYAIVEQFPASDPADAWTLDSVECNGRIVASDRGLVPVTLTPQHPDVHCAFSDSFTTHPPPSPEPSPTPTPPMPPLPAPPNGGRIPAYAVSDLALTKNALSSVVVANTPVRYEITVHNRGPDPAARVVIADQPQQPARFDSIHASTGHCQYSGRVAVCRLGNIAPGATETITVRLIP